MASSLGKLKNEQDVRDFYSTVQEFFQFHAEQLSSKEYVELALNLEKIAGKLQTKNSFLTRTLKNAKLDLSNIQANDLLKFLMLLKGGKNTRELQNVVAFKFGELCESESQIKLSSFWHINSLLQSKSVDELIKKRVVSNFYKFHYLSTNDPADQPNPPSSFIYSFFLKQLIQH